MFKNRASLISVIITVLCLLILDVLSLFIQMIVLNGVSEKQGLVAMGLWFLGQIFILPIAGALAGWMANFLLSKWNWNKVIAIIVACLGGIALGTILSFVSVILSMLMVGIN